MLNGFEIVAKIFDALANGGFVVVFEILENGAPDGHFGGAVSGEAGTKTKHAFDIFVRELIVVALGKSGEVRDAHVERGSGGAAALGVGAVASGAILFEHGFAGRDVAGGELRFVRFGLECGGG